MSTPATATAEAPPRDGAALLLAITHLPFGLAALARYMRAEAEIGPLTYGFEDLLLDNLPLSQKQAEDIGRIYRQLPWVADAIAEERRAQDAAIAESDDYSYPPPCTRPGSNGVHDWPDVEEHERCLCTWCGADGDA